MYLSSAAVAAAGWAGVAGFCCAKAGVAASKAAATAAANVFIIAGLSESLGLEQGIAAIDDEVAPRRVAGGVAGEINRERPEVGADAPASLGNARQDVAGKLRVGDGVGRHLGLDPARQDRVHRDVV